MSIKKLYFIILCVLCIFQSCSEGFLSESPDVKKRIPRTVDDFLGLMDHSITMNNNSVHVFSMIGSDEYYITDGAYAAFPEGLNFNYQKRAYTWDAFIFEGGESALLDWNIGYFKILWANTVLDGLQSKTVDPKDRDKADMTRGMALFHRAWNYYCLAQLFCKPFSENAHNDLGLPLRLESDLTMAVDRSTLMETYAQLITDLQKAEPLLPLIPLVAYRPGKAAVYALLARIYLQMGDYTNAYDYADRCLEIQNELINFNTLDFNAPLTFPAYGEGNPEVIFMSTCSADPSSARMLIQQIVCVDTNLLTIYDEGDLRMKAFFSPRENDTYVFKSGTYVFKGSYDGTNIFTYFTGLSVGEMLITRAECAARLGDNEKALSDVNQLRGNRYLPEYFTNLYSDDTDEILRWIIGERHREMVFRGTRWEDLRRLNKEPQFAKTLVRMVGDRKWELPPNDKRYVWPIPAEAIRMGGYTQNER